MAGVNRPTMPSAKLNDNPMQVNRTGVGKRSARRLGRSAVRQVMGIIDKKVKRAMEKRLELLIAM